MTMLRYIFSTPFSVIKQDCKEYSRLLNEESFYRNRVKYTFDNLVVDLGRTDHDATSNNRAGCVVQCWHELPDFGRDSDPCVSLHRVNCIDFSSEKLCTNTGCKYHKYNESYFDALAAKKVAVQKRKDFWKQKFSKQK